SHINLNRPGKSVCRNSFANIARITILRTVKSIVPIGTARYVGYHAIAAIKTISP
ncbi:unnamed protein product, partial [marine sediment metagenome]